MPNFSINQHYISNPNPIQSDICVTFILIVIIKNVAIDMDFAILLVLQREREGEGESNCDRKRTH